MSLRRQIPSLVALVSVLVVHVTTCLAGSVTLIWSAPGDDSLLGRAARYDLRYSRQTITSGNFSQATAAANLPTPGPSGSTQSAIIDALLPGQLYYFAIKCADSASNWSVMSNVISRVSSAVTEAGATFALQFSTPWPNPAREQIQFRLELPEPVQVLVEVFDVGGRHVRTLLDERREAGIKNLTFDLRDERGARLSQGIYLVRARLGAATFMRRLTITR
jgi:hypothetical protein